LSTTPRPGQPPGRQPLLDAVARFAAGFPDLEITVEQVVAEGDLVVQYGVMSGTNSGEWMGMPATNKPVRVDFIDMHCVVDGKVTESWHLEDIAGMLQQLGVAGG
jgi:predicted ester cyclase